TPLVISIGHVREPAVSYLGTPLPPLWKSHFASWQEMVAFFHKDFTAAAARADTLDTMIDRDAGAKGGDQYAGILALSLRQAFGGTELVSRNGKPWAFLKEISSDGNVSTIDVTYPCMPVFLYADPAYLALILEPMLDYAENGGWPKEFAEHDLGSHYPVADGHNDGNEEDMPVEESANMLIMCTAYLQRADGKSAKAFATAHYPILKKWSDYLVANALDPDLQNQTDDYTGFIAHSVNLALKGILGIGAMSLISTLLGKKTDAAYYLGVAKSYIGQWVTKATDISGDHLKLAYDQDGTWSLKYNGYPDKLLGLNLIPAKVAKLEAEWYLTRSNTYGVPLDLRHTYTKSDWEMWTAAWLHDQPGVTSQLTEGLFAFINTSGSRLPFTDWYDTVTDRQSGFQARPVVGGHFALLTL
ncbi:MAG: glutaminase domain-containing protein, partial [Nakamurella sp.]